MSNSVVKKYLFHIMVQLASPLCVSNGVDSITDLDVIRDYDGNPFVPGSSLAGAMRSYLDANSNVRCIFGNQETSRNKNDDRMSAAYVSDLRFIGKTIISVRDSVKLTADKTAETNAKFDMEIVDTGAKGMFSLELVVREQDNESSMLDEVKKLIFGLDKREIRLGSKKTRGYGEIALLSVKVKCYDRTNIADYANAYSIKMINALPERKDKWIKKDENSKFLKLTIPLELTGCISIRQYSAKKGLPDYVHITANGEPVIPGTSLTGAIRHRITEILKLDLKLSPYRFINEMFGYVDVKAKMTNVEKSLYQEAEPESGEEAFSQTEGNEGKKKPEAQRSMVVVNEAVLTGSKPLTIVRNGISRFESGTKEHALFKEISYQGGKTEIVIQIEKNAHQEAMVGLLALALADLENGYLAVGGQTAVGKGIFKATGDILIDDLVVDMGEYLEKAGEWILGGK